MFQGYHILIKFFKNGFTGNDYNKDDYLHHEKNSIEGDLQGIIEKVDYLKDLGIDLVYLGPIFDSETTHGYDTKDYFNISENISFSDKNMAKNLLKKLIDKLHNNNIKVILDLVLNHASKKYNFKNIPYNLIPKTEEPQSPQEKRWESLFLFWNVEDKNTKEFLIRVGEYWMNNFNIDGYRLDHAIGLPTSFWKDFYNRMKKIKKDVILLGEIWDDQGNDQENHKLIKDFLFFKNENVFTSLFDFSFYSKLVEYINNDKDLKGLFNSIIKSEKLNFDKAKMTYFIENHDLPRFIDYSNNINNFIIALGLIFVLNGNIMLEYGNEICLKGDKSYKYFNESGRVPMIFYENWTEKNKNIFELTKRLIELKKDESIFNEGNYKFLKSSSDYLFFEKNNSKNTLYILLTKKSIKNLSNKNFTNLIDNKFYKKDEEINPGIYFFK